MKDRFLGFLLSAAHVIFVIYMCIASFIFVPYYNWQYANQHGYVSWIFFGEIVATAKAFAFPYFVFSGNKPANNEVKKSKSKVSERMVFNENELEKIKGIFNGIADEELSDSQLNEFRDVMKGLTKRVNRYLSNEEVDDFLEVFGMTSEYRKELDNSLLASWEQKKYVTTKRFDELHAMMEMADPSKVKDDPRILKAASENQGWFEDSEGKKYEFSKNIILEVMGKNDVLHSNTEKIFSVVKEFAK
jgi:hypothetical protein